MTDVDRAQAAMFRDYLLKHGHNRELEKAEREQRKIEAALAFERMEAAAHERD